MTAEDVVIVNIRLPRQLHEQVAAAAKAAERNFAQQVRWLLAQGLDAETPPARPPDSAIPITPTTTGWRQGTTFDGSAGR